MRRRWRVLGMIVQGLLLGGLLFFATVRCLMVESGARIFRYQNF